MFSRIVIAKLGAITLGLCVMAQVVGSLPAEAGGAAGPQVIRADQLTKQQFRQQFRRLPDSAVIEFQGQRMTKGQMRTMAAQKAQAAMAKVEAAARPRRAQFEQEQATLQAANARVLAEIARIRQRGAIEQEAAQLWQRAQRASPAEQAQIEQRASQLLQQLQQMGR